MNKKETEIFIKELKKFGKELLKDPEKCKEFLQKTGIYTPKGRLRKPYKG